MNLYGLLKVLHVLSVVVWVGGVTALWTVMLKIGRSGDRPRVAEFLPLVRRYGVRVAGPASLIVLLTGIAMGLSTRLGLPFWIQIGFAGILLQIILGATIVRKGFMALGQAAEPAANSASFSEAIRRFTITSWIYFLLMALVIADMVIKPSL